MRIPGQRFPQVIWFLDSVREWQPMRVFYKVVCWVLLSATILSRLVYQHDEYFLQIGASGNAYFSSFHFVNALGIYRLNAWMGVDSLIIMIAFTEIWEMKMSITTVFDTDITNYSNLDSLYQQPQYEILQKLAFLVVRNISA